MYSVVLMIKYDKGGKVFTKYLDWLGTKVIIFPPLLASPQYSNSNQMSRTSPEHKQLTEEKKNILERT